MKEYLPVFPQTLPALEKAAEYGKFKKRIDNVLGYCYNRLKFIFLIFPSDRHFLCE